MLFHCLWMSMGRVTSFLLWKFESFDCVSGPLYNLGSDTGPYDCLVLIVEEHLSQWAADETNLYVVQQQTMAKVDNKLWSPVAVATFLEREWVLKCPRLRVWEQVIPNSTDSFVKWAMNMFATTMQWSSKKRMGREHTSVFGYDICQVNIGQKSFTLYHSSLGF